MTRNIFKNRFSTKIILVILIVCLIPTVFNSLIFYLSSSLIVKENVRESSIQTVQQAAEALSFIFAVGSDTSNLIYSNERLQNIVKQDLSEEINAIERSGNNDYMTSFLNSSIYSSSFVRIIYVLKSEGESWGSGTFSKQKFEKYNLQEQEWVKKSIELDGEVYWQELQFDQLSGAGENTEFVLPLSRVMKDFRNLNNIAYIQVLLDGNAIINKINKIKLGKTGHFFVVDEQGSIMIDPNIGNINKKVKNKDLFNYVTKENILEFEFTNDHVDYYGIKQKISNGWTLIGVVPISEITGGLTKIQHLIVLTSSIFGLVAIFIGFIVANRVTRPVKDLTNQMRLVGKGNFDVKTNVQSTDEIGMMSMEFNRMLDQIMHLLKRVKDEQLQKKEAELRAVKHRINPHFLFNTLSTVRWLVQFGQVDRANSALSALSRLLEANMGKKGTFVTIMEEIDIVEKFVSILQIRYEQIFHLKLEIDHEVADFLIPQMLLQPIIENAIFHGIVPTGKEGLLQISAHKVENGVEIKILDNGIGFEKDTLNKLQQKNLDKGSIGIGLLHVFESVRLYFLPESNIDISSSMEGTVVKLLLISEHRGGSHV